MPRFDGAAHDRESDERREDLGKERDDVDREHAVKQCLRNRSLAFACALEALDRARFRARRTRAERAARRADGSPRASAPFCSTSAASPRIGLRPRERARADFAAALECDRGYAPALDESRELAAGRRRGRRARSRTTKRAIASRRASTPSPISISASRTSGRTYRRRRARAARGAAPRAARAGATSAASWRPVGRGDLFEVFEELRQA